MRKQHYLAAWMERKGFSNTDIVEGAPVSFRTLRRIIDGEEFYVSTMKKICEYIGIPYEQVWIHPNEFVHAHSPPGPPGHGKKEPPDLATIPEDPDANIMGVPLTPAQRRALKYMIDGFKEELKQNTPNHGDPKTEG